MHTLQLQHAPTTIPGPVGRVTAASLVTGAAGAGVLTLAVFPGATESTMTGSILVAFGAGWALLARLADRMTRPQSWARVPAWAMTLSGLALLALRPGDSVLTALNWVWPVAVVALAVWMHRQLRASSPKRMRRLLLPVAAVLVAASLGATYQNVASVGEAPGHLYEVDGRFLHLDCHGEGEPTTLLFNGLGGTSASWAWITTGLERTGRVCAYDRAGQGWSEAADEPQDARSAARDLHAVLAEAGEEGPYVLVGHSTGGPYALTYAATYAAEVAGMVLLDSASPHQFDLPTYPLQYAVMRRALALEPTLWRLGVGHLLSALAPASLPEPAASQYDALSASPAYARNMRDEIAIAPEVFTQARTLTTLGSLPLAVLTASGTAEGTNGWTEAQDELAGLSSNHLHRVVETSHEGLLAEEPAAAEAARAIAEVVAAVRGD